MRLTEKDYCGYDIKNRNNFNGYDNEEDSQKIFNCLQKLGQLENIEEEFEIDNIEDLRDRLTIYKFLANHEMSCVDVNAYNLMLEDLDEYHSIEKELGIDLVTLFKAFTQGFIYMDIKENNKGISKIVKFEVGGILFDKEDKVWRLTNDDRYDGAYWGSIATTKNYGKTWALTKEELL